MATCTDWAWWKSSPGARSPAEKEWNKIPPDIQGELTRLMERWEAGDLQPVGGDCERLGQQDVLYLRVRRGNNHYRLYFRMKGTIAVVLHVAYKNQQKIDKATMSTIIKRAKQV